MTGQLDAIGRKCGTDLSSLGRDHLRLWERYLTPLRGEPFDLLEIGVGAGASLRTWREWFPLARLVGLDVRRVVPQPPIDNCFIVHGNQTDPTILRQLVRDHRFRLIVDDGSSHADDKLHSFLALFPWLEPNSAYICADIGGGHETVNVGPGAPDTEPMAMSGAASPAWFANLGIAVATKCACSHAASASSQFAPVLRQATGVSLLPGSVVVTT